MVWSTAVFVLSTLLIKRVALASIDYEPIQITVNENFNSRSGSEHSPPARSGILHQGANFYFKPQINIPPAHIEALTSLVQQDRTPKREIETENLIEILKSLPKILGAKDEKREDILKLLSSLSVPVAIKDEIPRLMQKIVPIVGAVKKEPITLEESTDVISLNPAVMIPEAPTLLPLAIEEIVPVVEEVKLEKPVVIEELVGVLSPIAEVEVVVPEEPNLSFDEKIMPIVEEVELIQPALLEETVDALSPIVEVSATENDTPIGDVIPEAPTLPPLSIEDIVPVVETVEVLEPVMLEETFSVISEAPTLSPPIIEDIVPVVEDVEILAPVMLEETVGVIPEVATLSPPIIEDIVPVVEDVEILEPVMLEETVGVIPEVPILSAPIIEDIVPVVEDVEILEPVMLEETVGIIPEAPTLSPPIIEDIVSVLEDVEILEPVMLEETVGVISETPTVLAIKEFEPACEEIELVDPIILEEPAAEWSLITEIDETILESSTLPPPSIEEIEPIILEESVGSLSTTTEISEIIPDGPTLLPLLIEDIVPAVEEVELVEPEILEENMGVLLPVTKMEQFIPDAPTLSPIAIENVDLIIEDILLKEPDILEELIKMISENDRAITETSTLTPLSIGENYSIDRIVLEKYADVFASSPKIDIIVPETIIHDEHIPISEEVVIDPCVGLKEPAYYMSNTSEALIIPGAPKVSFSEAPCVLVESTNLAFMDLPESTIITEPVLESDTAEYFTPEKLPPIIVEDVNKDVIMGDSAEMFPNKEGTKLELNKEPSANSTTLDEVSQTVSYIPAPTNNQMGVFQYGPIISQMSIPKSENSIIPKPKSLKNALVKGRPYRFRTYPYPNLSLKKQSEHNNAVLIPTSYAHDIVKNKNITPNKYLKKTVSELEKPFTNL